MSKYNKVILFYPQFQAIINTYLSLDEFKSKAPDTMQVKRSTIISFCNFLGDNGIPSLSLCKQKNVSDFMQSISYLSTQTKSGKSFILRHFFNYLYHIHLTIFSGNNIFPVIITNKKDRLLSFYSEKEVKQLIALIDNTTIKGKRDLLIILFAAELGIRSSDISRFKLTDFHWERNTIEFTQYKTGIFNQLPLLENIKFALIDYLRSARPETNTDLLFFGIKNNHGLISSSQIHLMVSKYFKKAGLDISKRKHGPHALRHSLASTLLSNNTPMYVIKDVLGHSNLNTTKTYLNIDFGTLKKFALEVPDENKR